jgi:two-component sensor histidine kinase
MSLVVDGPELTLRADAAQVVGMVLHELATNAAKYGALSLSSGRVSVSWQEQRTGDESSLQLIWQESGGPLVCSPTTRSYGTSVIQELVGYELSGTVRLNYAPKGVICEIVIPAERAIARW